jgi:serine protease Do
MRTEGGFITRDQWEFITMTQQTFIIFLSTISLGFLLLTGGCAPPSEATESEVSRADFGEVVKQAKSRVFPAVVFVKCLRESHEQGKKEQREVSGSGVLISADGELLTNWHVVDKASEIRCLLQDGRAFHATVQGSDKDLDIALVALDLSDDDDPVPFAELGDSSALKEGDFVMAMGAPWGLARSVSIGIVSCINRYLLGHSEYSLWLQTDASISPGNSGGPLIDTHGKIVGINTRGVMYGGNMGFAVPSSTIREILAGLRDEGCINWSWIGLKLQPLRDFNGNAYFDATNGVIVAGVTQGSPASRAGLKARDRLIKINDQSVNGINEENLPAIRRMIGRLSVGEGASFTVIRNEAEVVIPITPSEKGSVEGDELDCPRWDMTVKAINQFDNPDLHFYCKEGVFVFGVKRPGNASDSRIQRSDIIQEIDGQKVKTLADMKRFHEEALANVATKPRILLTILRAGMMRQLVLNFSRDYEKQ